MTIKRYSDLPKLQHYRNPTIRLFSVISRTLLWRVTPLLRSWCILQLQPTRQKIFEKSKKMIFCSLVKVITAHTHTHIHTHTYTHTHTHIHTHTHTHTHTHEYRKTFLLGQTVAILATHCDLYIQETTANLPRGTCIFIHTYTKYYLYDHTQ